MSLIPTDEPQIKDFEPFDYGVWGAIVRKHRKEMNYNAEQFTEFLELATRIKIHPQTYYKIEQGKQNPSHAQYMGINLAVFDDVEPPEEVKQMCLSKEWKHEIKMLAKYDEEARRVQEADDLVPYEWACTNFFYANEKLNEEVAQGVYGPEAQPVTDIRECSKMLKIPIGYFNKPN